MQLLALATDYDGTVAHEGVMDGATITALERLKRSGRKIVLATGRVLPELVDHCPRLDLFDLAVIENGAVVYDPATGGTRMLAVAPPPAFAAELAARGVDPVGTGQVIVATFQPHQDVVQRTIHDLGLSLEVIFNKDAVMVLPRGVDKATGLAAALEMLGVAPRSAVGVGDAENDLSMLRLCGLGAAVANSLPGVKSAADLVLAGARGQGVIELIDRMLAGTLESRRQK